MTANIGGIALREQRIGYPTSPLGAAPPGASQDPPAMPADAGFAGVVDDDR
ncbi:hypothetical protein [Kitasatospora sp. NPDC098663]|uniref:hypothetical protein n=1 Tax=Kitasatospora sp. NPDC098663 TaxID=3364096 RepID=UPI00380865A2